MPQAWLQTNLPEASGHGLQGIAALFEAIKVARTNKEIAKLRQQASALAADGHRMLAGGIASHLDTTTPIAPGAKRTGAVAFTQPRGTNPTTLKAIFVVRDTTAGRDYFVGFEFRPLN